MATATLNVDSTWQWRHCRPVYKYRSCFEQFLYEQRIRLISVLLYDRNMQPSSERSEAATDDADEIDPKLKEAILKSRKLDRILQRKFEREKNVKRERMQLHYRCVMCSAFISHADHLPLPLPCNTGLLCVLHSSVTQTIYLCLYLVIQVCYVFCIHQSHRPSTFAFILQHRCVMCSAFISHTDHLPLPLPCNTGVLCVLHSSITQTIYLCLYFAIHVCYVVCIHQSCRSSTFAFTLLILFWLCEAFKVTQ